MIWILFYVRDYFSLSWVELYSAADIFDVSYVISYTFLFIMKIKFPASDAQSSAGMSKLRERFEGLSTFQKSYWFTQACRIFLETTFGEGIFLQGYNYF